MERFNASLAIADRTQLVSIIDKEGEYQSFDKFDIKRIPIVLLTKIMFRGGDLIFNDVEFSEYLDLVSEAAFNAADMEEEYYWEKMDYFLSRYKL